MAARPNILFITTDQQRQDSLPCYGLEFVQAPALDRLAREGVVFDRCTSVSPVCQPARASFMMGQYPHLTGVPDNFRWLRPGSPTIARLLGQAGYRTAAIGKMHFHPWDNREGFDYRVSAEDKRHFFRPDDYTRFLERHGRRRRHPAEVAGYGQWLGAMVSDLPEELHLDSFVGEEAVRWLEKQGDEPFFAWVSFNSPHDPYDPPESLAGLYRDAPVPEAVGSAAELAGKPAYQRDIVASIRDNLLYLIDYATLTPAVVRRMREHYLSLVSLVDRQIGRILEVLDRRGLAENTVVVFSSDHGDHLGDHGLPFKGTFYEGPLMVPLLVRAPGAAAGRRCEAFVDWLDLHATFLAQAGVPAPEYLQGTDLSPLLRQPGGPGKPQAFSELEGSVMVRTERHKLVLCDDGDGELYDLEEQPLEVHNHFRDAAFAEVRQELAAAAVRHLLAHSRVRRFGGGRHASDPGRESCFAAIRETLAAGGFPGL